MPTISFKRPFRDAILAGEKTSTLRKHTRLQPGDRVEAYCEWGKPPFAVLEVVGVDRVSLHELDEWDAAEDGFPSAADLRKTLDDLYPRVENFSRLRFVVVEPTSGT